MKQYHSLDFPGHNINMMRDILFAMVEDVIRESKGEIVDSKEARKAISQKTAIMYKSYLNEEAK